MTEKEIWKHCVRDSLCIRCGKFINSQTFFGVLCEKCNEMWIGYAQRNGVSPLADSDKKVWYNFINMNPSSRY